MISFNKYSRKIRAALRKKRYSCRRVASSSGLLSVLFGSQDLGWECTCGDSRFFVGRERDYWIATVDTNGYDNVDLIDTLDLAIERGIDSRQVDQSGLDKIVAWIRREI